MAATKEHIFKDVQQFPRFYNGGGYLSKKIEKTDFKFTFEHVELLESISILQKPTGQDYYDGSNYDVKIDCRNKLNAIALHKILAKQNPKVRIDDENTVVLESRGPDAAGDTIQFVKSLSPDVLSLKPDDWEKILSTIYGKLGQLELGFYTMDCLNNGSFEDAIKLNKLISNPGQSFTYRIARKLEKLARTDEAIEHYKKIPPKIDSYTNAQYHLSKLVVDNTPAAIIERLGYLVRSGEKGIPHLDKQFLQDVLQVIAQEKLKSMVCDKNLDLYVLIHLAEQFDSLAAKQIVDDLCNTLHGVLTQYPMFRSCKARYNLLLAKRLGTPEAVANDPELQASFYRFCLAAGLAGKKFRANAILIEQMQKDIATQPISSFLTNVLTLSLENTAIFYYAGMALVKQGRSLLAACLLQRVKSFDSDVFFELAANENMVLSGISLAHRDDMARIGSCIDTCVLTGKGNIAKSVAQAGAGFEEQISAPKASSSSEDPSSGSRIQALEDKVTELTSTVERLASQLADVTESRRKRHSSRVSSSNEHSTFFKKSSHSHHRKHSNKDSQCETADKLVAEAFDTTPGKH